MMIKRTKPIIQPRPSCISSFQTIYGLGRTKATRLSCFLLNHPIQTRFKKDFTELLSLEPGRNIGLFFPIQTKVRLFVSHHLKNKVMIFCYQAFRLFQGLPTKGQRTKANGGTPSHYNPYLSLKVNLSFYPEHEIEYKRRELMYNERFDELKTFNNALLEKEKMKKTDIKQKQKKSKESFMKKNKK